MRLESLWLLEYVHGRIAVCTYVRTRNSEPRLVALMAAQEEKDDYGEQVRSRTFLILTHCTLC